MKHYFSSAFFFSSILWLGGDYSCGEAFLGGLLIPIALGIYLLKKDR